VIHCDKRPKPKQIIWSMLSEEKLERIPILKKLRFMERQAGRDTRLQGQSEDLVIQPGEVYVEPEEPEEDEEEEDRRRNRRRYNRQRRPRGNRRIAENGEDGEALAPVRRQRRRGPSRRSEGDEGQEGEPRPPRRRNPRNNRRRRRSQGSESREDGEEIESRPRRSNYRRRPRRSNNEREDGAAGDDAPRTRPPRRSRSSNNGPLPAVYVGNLPRGLRVSEFKHKFREQNVNPLRVTWRGQVGYSYLVFESMDQVDQAMKVMSGMTINDRELRVELANRTQQRNSPPQQQEVGEGDVL